MGSPTADLFSYTGAPFGTGKLAPFSPTITAALESLTRRPTLATAAFGKSLPTGGTS